MTPRQAARFLDRLEAKRPDLELALLPPRPAQVRAAFGRRAAERVLGALGVLGSAIDADVEERMRLLEELEDELGGGQTHEAALGSGQAVTATLRGVLARVRRRRASA